MSRTDKDFGDGCLQCPQCGISHSKRGPGFRVNWVRPQNKAARQVTRLALRRGEEPPPSRHRHHALWDRF